MTLKQIKEWYGNDEPEELVEFATIHPKTSGLKHCIYYSAKVPQHGPRVKIANRCEETQLKGKYDIIAFNNKSAVLLEKGNIKIKNKERLAYTYAVKQTRHLLMKYWNFALGMTDEEQFQLKKEIDSNIIKYFNKYIKGDNI